MHQLDATAEPATAEPTGFPAAVGDSVTPFGLMQLVRRFRAQMERQQRHDGEVLAGLLRMLRRGGPDVEELCALINHRVADASAAAEKHHVTRSTSDEGHQA